jgi:hypothetical protein
MLDRTNLETTQSAELELIAGPVQLRLKASFTPLGLLTFGVAMSGIVASASAIVWAGRRRRRSHAPPP